MAELLKSLRDLGIAGAIPLGKMSLGTSYDDMMEKALAAVKNFTVPVVPTLVLVLKFKAGVTQGHPDEFTVVFTVTKPEWLGIYQDVAEFMTEPPEVFAVSDQYVGGLYPNLIRQTV